MKANTNNMSIPVNPNYVKFLNPFYMAASAALLSFVLMGLGKLAGFEGFTSDSGSEFPWMTSAAVILLFIIFSSIVSLVVSDINQYYKLSIPAFVVLIVVNSLLAYLFSGSWISEVGSYRWIYFILISGYLMLQLMTRFIKKIMQFAQKEDEEFRKRS